MENQTNSGYNIYYIGEPFQFPSTGLSLNSLYGDY